MRNSILALAFLFYLPQIYANTIHCQYFEDHQEVLHIKGANELNLYECLGYFHAKDRLYLMDYFRRAGQGRNAEVLGFKSVKNDFFLRALDFDVKSKKLYSEMNDEMKNILISYSNGVNEVISKKSWNFGGEFKALNYSPELWEPHHSLIILYLQSLNQTAKTFRQDLEESEWLESFGESALELFNEETTPWFTPLLKQGEYKEKTKVVNSKNLTKPTISSIPYDFSTETGSNSWIFSKQLTAGKKAMLANDPHLDLKRPAFWYWVHLEFEKINVIGSTIPGLPFVMSGTTPYLTWGLTNSYYDTADAVLIDESGLKDAVTIRPNIKFKMGPLKLPFIFKSYQVLKGKYPVLPAPAPKGKAIVFRWSGLDIKANDISGYHDILEAKNVTEAQSVFRKMGVPSWNFVFADHEGNIGYQVTGKLPKRETTSFGMRTIDLKDLDYEYLNVEENPSVLKPERNFVVTANQRHYAGGSHWIGGTGYSLSLRANRIESLLREKQKNKRKLTVNDFEEIQCDTIAHDAHFFIHFIKGGIKKLTLSNIEKQAFTVLENWDFSTSSSCEACPLYRRTMELLKDHYKVNETALYHLMEQNKVDVAESFKNTVKEMWSDKKGRFTNWDEFHRLHFEHISGREDLGTNESIFTMGDQHSINPGTAHYQNGEMFHYSGASQRVVVEMDNPPKVYLSFPGNNRGNYFASQGDTWNAWKACQFQNLHFPVDWSKVTLKNN
ncbi:MAG: penicillin acylase family protein [Bacteriovoracaceae bacterium]